MINLTTQNMINCSVESRTEYVAADFIARVSLSHDKRRTVVVLKDGSKMEVVDDLEAVIRRIECEMRLLTGES